MDWDKFRRFEPFCFAYDVGIDQEDYERGWKIEKGDPWPLTKDLAISSNNLETRLTELETKLPESCCWPDGYKRLVLVKRARAVLQRTNSSADVKKIDLLAEYLLRYLPLLANLKAGDDEESDDESHNTLLRAMYLNEVSSCFMGFFSIGFADQCSHLIKDKLDEGHTVQELIALYNKAQGYFHTANREKAFDGFQDVIEALKDDQSNTYYYSSVSDAHPGQVSSDAKQDLIRLLLVPSQLQQAECLIKMQRSREAREKLQQLLEMELDGYHRVKAILLMHWTSIDEGVPVKDEQVQQVLKEASAYPNLLCQALNLKVSAHHLLAQTELQKLSESGCRLGRSRGAVTPDFDQHMDSYHVILDLFNRQSNNTDEENQVIRLWTKGLENIRCWCDLIQEPCEAAHDSAEQEERTNEGATALETTLAKVKRHLELEPGQDQKLHKGVLRVFRDMFGRLDARELSSEIRKSYLDNLKSIVQKLRSHTKANPEIGGLVSSLEKHEIEALNVITNNKKIDLPQWLCKTYEDRKTLLGVASTTQDKQPTDVEELLTNVRRFVKTEFVDPASCAARNQLPERCKECGTYSCQAIDCTRALKDSLHANSECEYQVETTGRIKHYYDKVISRNWCALEKMLHAESMQRISNGVGLAILRRWNSFTPALALSEGGGYFLFQTDKNRKIEYGVAIDPGYDFLRNFFAAGFGIGDIHAILVSHDHPDHLEDFSAIVTLKREALGNRAFSRRLHRTAGRKQSQITAVLSPGAYRRLAYHIESTHEVFRDTVVINPKPPTSKPPSSIPLNRMQVQPIMVLHEAVDQSSDSVGFVIKGDSQDGRPEWAIGFPGDTKWTAEITNAFNDCDVLCYHAGSISERRQGVCAYLDDRVSLEVMSNRNHLYLPGTVAFPLMAKSTKDPLRILSEFGEELKGGIRVDYVNKLRSFVGSVSRRPPDDVPIIPSDTGLVINVLTKQVMCACCRQFYDVRFIGFEAFGSDERLFAVCSNCKRLLSDNQRQGVFRKIEESRWHAFEQDT